MQRRRLRRRRRSALLRLCASDSPVPHTKASSPHLLLLFSFQAPAEPAPETPGGLLATSPGQPGLWDIYQCQDKPRQTFPKLEGLGRDPGWRRACAPPSVPSSQGSREPGWSRTRIPGGRPSPCSQGSLGSGTVRLPWRLEVAFRRRALLSSAIFAHGSLQEGL